MWTKLFTTKKNRKGFALLCFIAILITSVLVPVPVKASYETDRQYMNLYSLTYEAEPAMNDSVYISGYKKSSNSPHYMLAIPAAVVITDNSEERKNIVRIGDDVFSGETFSQIYINSNSGLKIGAGAFRGVSVVPVTSTITDHCVNILGNGTTEIGEYAFADMRVTGDFVLENVSGDIRAHAFENLIVLEELNVNGKVDTIGDYAFAGVLAKSVHLPYVRQIGDGAFARTGFTEFTIPSCTETLGSNIFEGCEYLEKIYLPENGNMTQVAPDAFPNRENFTIVIPENITNINIYHLEQYNQVTFLLPANIADDSELLQYMKDNDLHYQTTTPEPSASPSPVPSASPTVNPTISPSPIPDASPSPEPSASPSPVPSVSPTVNPTISPSPIPDTSPSPVPSASPSMTPGMSSTARPTISPAPETIVKKIVVKKNIKYRIKDSDKVSVMGYTGKDLKELTIPNIIKAGGRLYKVTAIEKKAFCDSKKLKRVVLGNYIRSIGDEAFSRCNQLTSISFGTETVTVGKKVLYKDSKLKKILFRGNRLKKIGKKTFYGVPKSVKIVVPKTKVKQYKQMIHKTAS